MSEREFPRKRFYLPIPYEGPAKLALHGLGGDFMEIPAAMVSCFEEFKLRYCLRNFVELHLVTGRSIVLQEQRAEIETYMADPLHGA